MVFIRYLVLMIFLNICQVPKIVDKQGGQLLAVAVLVLSRTWISDRIASLNGWLFVSLPLLQELVLPVYHFFTCCTS